MGRERTPSSPASFSARSSSSTKWAHDYERFDSQTPVCFGPTTCSAREPCFAHVRRHLFRCSTFSLADNEAKYHPPTSSGSVHRVGEEVLRGSWAKRSVSGTQIHPSCCAGVFVDESAESIVSVDAIRRVGASDVEVLFRRRRTQAQCPVWPVVVVMLGVDAQDVLELARAENSIARTASAAREAAPRRPAAPEQHRAPRSPRRTAPRVLLGRRINGRNCRYPNPGWRRFWALRRSEAAPRAERAKFGAT